MADNIVINVIAVSPEVTKMNKAGKPYGEIEVTYKDIQNRVGNKKLLSFQAQQVYDTFKAAKNGDVFEVETVKNGDYRNWTRATPSSLANVANAPPATGQSSPTSNRSSGNTYETPEERALRRAFEEKKQVLIVRQSSLSNALEYHKNEKTVPLNKLLETADKLNEWVWEIADEPAKSIAKDSLEEEFDNDVPY